MKRIVVLGAGESGTGAALLAQAKGFEVFVSDLSSIQEKYKDQLNRAAIQWEEGKHTEELILNADEIVKSPGIPDKAPLIQKIKEMQIPILSEIELAGRYTTAKMICITGSNGKTTTTMLIYHLLLEAGYSVGLAGNVGFSLARQVIDNVFDYYVVELSSFQLDNMYHFRAHVAILLNITPDHLDRYDYKMQNYVDSKLRILQNQTPDDYLIYWGEDPILQQEMSIRPDHPAQRFPFALDRRKGIAAWSEQQMLTVYLDGYFTLLQSRLTLAGTHNLFNAMAATLTALALRVPQSKISKGLQNFPGVEHRLENAGEADGVVYINDSKATNVNSCFYALQSMKRPTVLILGGTDKGNDYTEIEALVHEKVKALVFMGIDNTPLTTFFADKGVPYVEVRSIDDALRACREYAAPGDAVLLSPCCASFDLFRNYEDRGRQFKALVRTLQDTTI